MPAPLTTPYPFADRADKLVAQFGSPLYVYDVDAVRMAYRDFLGKFPYAPLSCHYAIVCNKNRHLVCALAEEGAGFHANTPGDAFAALAAGVAAQRITYAGTNLDAADFAFLLGRGIHLDLDSLDQLRDLAGLISQYPEAPRDVGLRLLIDDPQHANRIGVSPDELHEALEIATAAGLRLTRLHMYAGTNTLVAERILHCFDRLIEASDALPDLAALDLGGGFGVPYSPDRTTLDLSALGAAVALRMQALSARRARAIGLVLEPGRVIVARSGSLLMRVVSVKERGGRRFVGVDSTVGNVVVPSVYHPYHRIDAVTPVGPVLAVPTDVCGNTTHSRDFLGRDMRLPFLAPGDLLVLRDVGAYGYAMSSHFLNRPRPAEVVMIGGEAHLSTRRESFEDLLAGQLIP